MKKLLLTLVACFVAIAANAWTVYFTNPEGWSQVAVWAWDKNTNANFTGGSWPGKLMTKDSSTGLWTYTGTGNPNMIIFNNNNNGKQTDNLTFEDGATYDLYGPVGAERVVSWEIFGQINSGGWTGCVLSETSSGSGVWEGSYKPYADTGEFGVRKMLGQAQQAWYSGRGSITLSESNSSITLAQDGGTNVKYNLTAGREYNFIWNEKTLNLSITWDNDAPVVKEYPDEVYVIGTIPGGIWNPSAGKLMTKGENGVYTIENLELVDNNGVGTAFSFCTKISDSWDIVNSGLRWGAAAGGSDVSIQSGQQYPLVAAGDPKAFIGGVGVYNIKIDLENLTMVASWEPKLATPDALYLIGTTEEDGGWNIASPIAMNSGNNDSFTVSNVAVYPAEGGEYGYFGLTSVNGGDWGDINANRYGPADNDTEAVASNPFVRTDYNSWKIQPAIYNFTVIFGDQSVVNVEKVGELPTEPSFPEKLYLSIGTGTNQASITFKPDTDQTLEQTSDGVYTASNIDITTQKAFIFYSGTTAAPVKYAPSAWRMIYLTDEEYYWPLESEESDGAFVEGGTWCWVIYTTPSTGNGTYNVTVDLNTMMFKLEANLVEPEPLYLMGYDEDGNVTLRQEMTPSSTDPKVYEYTYTVPNYSKGFKFYFSTTGKTEAKNNFVPTVANQSIRFGADNTYKATWSNVGVGNAVDYVAGETTFRFNIETLECELKYEGALVNFEFTGVENAYYYVNMFNLTGDDNVVYLNSNSVQYGIDKSGTSLSVSPKDGYTLEITCPEAQSTTTYMITPGGQGDEQMISLYPGAQGYTFTFTVSEKVEAEPVYSFNGQLSDFDLEVDGNIASWVGVLKPEAFVIEKKVNGNVVETYRSNATEPGNQITAFGDFTGAADGTLDWVISAVVVNDSGSPIAFSFDTETLVLTVSTGLTASAGTADTQQSGTVENGAASGNIDLVSNQDYAWVFFNVPEEATAVYYRVTNVTPLTNARRNAAPEGYQEADTWEWDSPEKGSYYAQLLSGTSGTLDVIYEIGDAQSRPTTYNYKVTQNVPTGVDGIDADEEGAEYYTIDGVKVLNPERGIFIRVKDGKVSKVVK